MSSENTGSKRGRSPSPPVETSSIINIKKSKSSPSDEPEATNASGAAPSASASLFSSVFDTGGGMRALNAENSASSSEAKTSGKTAEEDSQAAASVFASSGFASYSSNPFGAAASIKPSGFGAVSADEASNTLAPASSNAFASSGFSSFTSSNPFQAALAAAGNRGSKPSGFGFGAPTSTSTSTSTADTTTDSATPKALFTSTAPAPTSTNGSSADAPTEASASSAASEAVAPADTSTPAAPQTSSEPDSKAPLSPPPPPQVNGEEEEECVLQLRVKSFKLTTLKDVEKATSKKDGDEEATEKAKPPPKVGEWKEMGIGPIRALVPISSLATSTVRLVQRRETTPGGQGTKVLLNATIGQCDLTGSTEAQPAASDSGASGKVYKPEGKFCRVSILHKSEEDENPHVVNYLLKFKSEQERKSFTDVIQSSTV